MKFYCYECSSKEERKELEHLVRAHRGKVESRINQIFLFVPSLEDFAERPVPTISNDTQKHERDVQVTKEQLILAIKNYRTIVALESI